MPTEREIELYYFDIWEASQLVGRPHVATISGYIRDGKVEAVKHRQKWMIAPDQLSVLRELLYCRPDGLKKSQGFEVRSLFSKLLRWCTSA
ncbi:MAG: hypothetical protein NUV74_05375 [Candidatus Brocadiaceae bacterium]|nr:hypothetical protein [Candidatus Brocadiaceae bacterium]